MKTDDLINQLSRDLKPVRPVLTPGKFVVFFSALSALVVLVGVSIFHTREDLVSRIAAPSYLGDLLCPFLFTLCAIVLIARLSVPGRGRGAFFSLALASSVIVYFAIEIGRSFLLNRSDFSAGLDVAGAKCYLMVLLLAAFPVAALVISLLRRAPTRPLTVGLLIALAGIGCGEIAIALHCPIDNAVHISLWHIVLPVLTAAATGTFVLSRLIRW